MLIVFWASKQPDDVTIRNYYIMVLLKNIFAFII